jgi:hypothetical protein
MVPLLYRKKFEKPLLSLKKFMEEKRPCQEE